MAVLISDEDYKEYRILQHNAIFQQKLISIKELQNLKNDIDAPIRKLVAMFALLGCEPMWSCCGFDYDGQPMHKTHEYGDVYIILKNSLRVIEILEVLLNEKVIKVSKREMLADDDQWRTWASGNLVFLQSDFDFFHVESNYPWRDHNCVHFSELSIIKIDELEQELLRLFSNKFMDTVILKDTNYLRKQRLYNWQYPVLDDWVITKEDIL